MSDAARRADLLNLGLRVAFLMDSRSDVSRSWECSIKLRRSSVSFARDGETLQDQSASKTSRGISEVGSAAM